MELHTIFFWLYDNFTGENIDRIKRELFFCTHFVCKIISFLFFLLTELKTDDEIINERYSDGCIPSMN
jgi:hypothetical protein